MLLAKQSLLHSVQCVEDGIRRDELVQATSLTLEVSQFVGDPDVMVAHFEDLAVMGLSGKVLFWR